MFSNFPIFPEAASSLAGKVDALYFFLVGVSLFFFLLVCALVAYFALRFRRRADDEQPQPLLGSLKLELVWTIIPFFLSMVMFSWGASLYFDLFTPPAEAMNIYVVGKQWMWKIQHPEGKREINELHIPVGTPVKLIMTSEDVIHSFFVPAFRTKMDVLPGRYTTTWFEATKPGKYHLFCAEYCGTQHSGMVGSVYAMNPVEYQAWLDADAASSMSVVEAGEGIYNRLSCGTCHAPDSGARGPDLRGIYGTSVRLLSGDTVLADENYIRESIVDPSAKITNGYGPLMPTYKDQIEEEDLLKLVAYIRSLSTRGQEESSADERNTVE